MTEQFIQERRYLLGVSPRTVIWYQCSFKAFEGAMNSREAVRQRIVDLHQLFFVLVAKLMWRAKKSGNRIFFSFYFFFYSECTCVFSEESYWILLV